jgi:hypothetical protein
MSETNTVSPLRQPMIEDMAARKLNPHTQRSHIHSCKRFAAWLKRSPDTAMPDEVRRFQLYLIESGTSICNRNRIMTGVRFLFRVTLRRHDLAAEVCSTRCQPVPNFPRLRALALFGRRPPQRVDSLLMPASENLHKTGRSPTATAVVRSTAEFRTP